MARVAGDLDERAVWHLRGAHARRWLRLVDQIYYNARDHGQWLAASQWARDLGLPGNAFVISSPHPKVAQAPDQCGATQRSLFSIAKRLEPGV